MAGPSDPEAALQVSPSISRRREVFGLIGVALCVVLALGGVAVASRRLPPLPRPAFDSRPLRAMRAHPDYVLLGNSMVSSRFDIRTLRRLLAPRRALMLSVGGSMSAMWYAEIKNYIVASHRRPRRLIIFFRNEELTRVRDQTTGADLLRIQEASPQDDPVLLAKIVPPWNAPADRLKWHLWNEVHLERLRAAVELPIDGWVGELSSALNPSGNPERSRRLMNSLFRSNAVRDGNDKPDPVNVDQRPFEVIANESLLPDILQLVTENHIPTVFVRVRTRARARGFKEPTPLRRYNARLRHYIQSHGADFVDMSQEEWETLSLFGNGDHIAQRHTVEYTRLFVQHMPQVFQ